MNVIPVFVSFHYFFFSSRRRHTRCLSDWSSDVCSSDLSESKGQPRWSTTAPAGVLGHASLLSGTPSWSRSEERRVGKSVEVGGSRRSRQETSKSNIRGVLTGRWCNRSIW